jgi:hypothetical protein
LPAVNRDITAIDQIERQLGLAGKRVADVPDLAWFRRKFRWRFYRLADTGMFLTIFGTILATWPSNPAWFVAVPGALMGFWTALFAERRARLMTRQLKRRAAEQLWLDANGRFDE